MTSAAGAAALVEDGQTLAVAGAGGGLLEPDLLVAALAERFERTDRPRDLTLVHTFGLGDRATRGFTALARAGLLRRVIGGHFGQTPALADLAARGEIEAYNLPIGILALLHREIAAGRPGLFTDVGLGTFVDPRLEGGRVNTRTTEDIVEVVTVDGRELLRFKPYAIDVAFLRGWEADRDGNVTLDGECARLDSLALALAAHREGGRVAVQVKRVVDRLAPAQVHVPGALVDHVVEHPDQWQTYHSEFEPAFAGQAPGAADAPWAAPPAGARAVIARRAVLELQPGMLVNIGVGVPDGVGTVLRAEGCSDAVTLTVEHGIIGGVSAPGTIFGAVSDQRAFVDTPSMMDLYHGGALDAAFLGFAQVDAHGDVNVSRFDGRLVGSGGFVDIAQCARTVVFCGTLRTTRGAPKLLPAVEQVTFCGRRALEAGHRVVVVTERAVFVLEPEGLTLAELAPDASVEEVAGAIGFAPRVPRPPTTIDPAVFGAGPLGLRERWGAA